MKILTNIRFAQTAGIAQMLFSFLDFVEKGTKNDFQVIGVNIINQKEESYKKNKKKKVGIVSMGLRVPEIAKVMRKAKKLDDVKKRYSEIIEAYQRVIKKEKPDLILINGTYYMPWCLLCAAEKENIPVVLHYHGVLTKETQNWKARQRKIFKEMERCFDKKNIFYIFPSEITKRVVENEVFGHKIKNCIILPNPVPAYFFKDKIRSNRKNIGIISRWARIKNIEFCGKLAKYNQSKGSKFNINLITDIKPNRYPLKGWSKIIKVYTPMDNKKLVNFYKKMGAIISPSFFETYGNVAKEAIATGTPALVNSNMGVSETFRKLGLGDLVIKFDSVKKVYDKIENVIGQRIDENIRVKIKKLYSSPKIFNKMIEILQTVNSVQKDKVF